MIKLREVLENIKAYKWLNGWIYYTTETKYNGGQYVAKTKDLFFKKLKILYVQQYIITLKAAIARLHEFRNQPNIGKEWIPCDLEFLDETVNYIYNTVLSEYKRLNSLQDGGASAREWGYTESNLTEFLKLKDRYDSSKK